MPETSPTLADEAEYLYSSLFVEPIEDAIVARYQAAHQKLFPDESDSITARVVARHLDVEAVEVALRRRGRGAVLTRKLQILFYLLEVRQRYQSRFVAACPTRFGAWVELTRGAARTGYLLLKGEYLIHVHGLL